MTARFASISDLSLTVSARYPDTNTCTHTQAHTHTLGRSTRTRPLQVHANQPLRPPQTFLLSHPPGKTSNKWRDMIKVRNAPGFGKKSPSLREWATKHRVTLGDPDVEEAIAQCSISYEDERVPLDGVGRGQGAGGAVEEGWVAVEDPASGGFSIGYIWRNQQVGAGGGGD